MCSVNSAAGLAGGWAFDIYIICIRNNEASSENPCRLGRVRQESVLYYRIMSLYAEIPPTRPIVMSAPTMDANQP